jgi:hypothetical protein
MKRRLAFALVGLAISFASPTLAQDPALKTGSAQDGVLPETAASVSHGTAKGGRLDRC